MTEEETPQEEKKEQPPSSVVPLVVGGVMVVGVLLVLLWVLGREGKLPFKLLEFGKVPVEMQGPPGPPPETLPVGLPELRVLAAALDKFRLDNGFYPTNAQGLTALLWKPERHRPEPPNWRRYLDGTPNPLVDPWGNLFQYYRPGTHNPDSYDLYSLGPDGVDDSGDEITNWGTTQEGR